jgi:PAS domain S-box-containing protein
MNGREPLKTKQKQTQKKTLRARLRRLNRNRFQAEIEHLKAQLAASEERFRLVSEESFEGLVIHEGGRVLEANQVLADMFGYTLSEFKQLSYHELIDPEDFPLIVQKMASGDITPYEAKAIKKDGSRFPIEGQPKNIVYKGRPMRVMAIRDITERHRREELLRRQQYQIQAILDNSTANIYLKDAQGRYLLINRRVEQTFGLQRQEVVGKTDRELFPADDFEQWNANDRQVLATGKGVEQEEEIMYPDGLHTVLSIKFPLLNEHGQPYAVGGISTDITTRKQAEQEARKYQQLTQANQNRLAGIISSAMDAIITVTAEGQIAVFNQAAEKMFGCSAADVIGQTLDRFLPTRFRSDHLKHILRFGDTGNTTRSMGFHSHLYALRANGQEFPIEATISHVEVQEQKLYTVFIRDVSEKIQAYQLLEQRVAQRTAELSILLEISQKLAATLDPATLTDYLLDRLPQLLEYDAAVFYSSENQTFKLGKAMFAFSPQHLELIVPALLNSVLADTLISQKKPVIIENLADLAVLSAKTGALPTKAGLFVPIIIKDGVAGIFAFTHPQTGFYSAEHARLAQSAGYKIGLAIENSRLYEQAQRLAALEERQRLARELHDSTSQVLYSIQLGVRAARNFLQQEQPEQATETLTYVSSLAKGGLDEMRTLIFELQPEALAKEGLLNALRRQAVSLEARHGIAVELRLGNDATATEPDFLPLFYKETIYRIAREALHNAVKHSQTSKIELKLSWDEREVCLAVRDYGVGFERQPNYPNHFGLQSITQRVTRLSGNLVIESSPGAGTFLQVVLPYTLSV